MQSKLKHNASGLSIVIPAYNASGWIIPTIEHINAALKSTTWKAEIVIINDGSTDSTLDEIKQAKNVSAAPVVIIDQPNTGRYLARKVGVAKAKYENILFIDSRIFMGQGALAFLEKRIAKHPGEVWNGHVHVDKVGNIFARFWDAIVFIAWRRYFGNPRETSYGIEEFDYYPKGTTFFFVPKTVLQDAMNDFEKATNDIRFSSDDTLLIRKIATDHPIHLSPEFDCLYHGRSTFGGFLKHAFYRGQFFVDGFLRPGNRFFIPLLLVLLFSVAAIIALLLWPLYMVAIVLTGCVLLVPLMTLAARALSVPWKDAASLGVLAPLFGGVYLAGIWRGVLRKVEGQDDEDVAATK